MDEATPKCIYLKPELVSIQPHTPFIITENIKLTLKGNYGVKFEDNTRVRSKNAKHHDPW